MNPFHTPQGIIALLIGISILVVAHEWGHFIVARIFGIRVDDFSVGFGKRIFRVGKLGDTEYNIRMLPLGGFVKIHGMDADEEPLVRAKEQITGKKDGDPNSTEIPLVAENTAEKMDDQGPDSFATKPLWQRSLVILAGPAMSFLLGYGVLCLMGGLYGLPTGATLNKVRQVQPGGEGQRIGLRVNDVIVAIDGRPINTGSEMITAIHNGLGQMLHFTVQRGNKTLELNGRPRPLIDDHGQVITFVRVDDPAPFPSSSGLRAGDYIGGFRLAGTTKDIDIHKTGQLVDLLHQNAGKTATLSLLRNMEPIEITTALPSGQAVPRMVDAQQGILNFVPATKWERISFKRSIQEGNNQTLGFFSALGDLFHHRQELQKSAGGIIAIYQATDLAAQTGPGDVVLLYAKISLSLAVFNLFPIPVLDGGHLLSFLIEWLRRGRKFTLRQQQAFLLTGFAVIIMLVILVNYNDIVRTIRHQIPQ